jgi:hypothetical protein
LQILALLLLDLLHGLVLRLIERNPKLVVSEVRLVYVDPDALDVLKLLVKDLAMAHAVQAHVVVRHIDGSDQPLLANDAILDPAIECAIAVKGEIVERVHVSRRFHVNLTTHLGSSESWPDERAREQGRCLVSEDMGRANSDGRVDRPRSLAGVAADVDVVVAKCELPDPVSDLRWKSKKWGDFRVADRAAVV